jgi:hypothetical protein
MEDTMQPVLENYLNMFHFEAEKCFAKLKKPSCYCVEDLESEGVLLWLEITKNHSELQEPDFHFYFKVALINKLNSILIESYKRAMPDSELIENIEIPSSQYDPLKLTSVFMKISSLPIIELKYLQIILSPDKKTQEKFKVSKRHKLMIPREMLNLTPIDDLKVRKNIKMVLVG